MYIQLEFEYLQSIYSELLVCLSLIFNRKQFNIDISLNEHKRQSLLLSNQIL